MMWDRFRHADYRDFTGITVLSAQDGRVTRIKKMRLPPFALPALSRPAFVGLCVSLAALTACDERGVRITTTHSSSDAKGVLKVVDALQCPESLGALTRKGSAQADGTVCTYTGPRGAEVTLSLVRLDDQPVDAILAGYERSLQADIPRAAAAIEASLHEDARAKADLARLQANEARADADKAADGGDSAHISGPGMKIDAEGDRARVSLPGIHVDADGDKANVRIGGFTIRANDSSASSANDDAGADTSSGGKSSTVSINGDLSDGDARAAVSVHANDNGAEVRTRSRGDATRQSYRLSDSDPREGGWRSVGYEARGPRGGPIVIATVRIRERRSDRIFDDAKELVALNVGQ
jgi:hypothetical protein